MWRESGSVSKWSSRGISAKVVLASAAMLVAISGCGDLSRSDAAKAVQAGLKSREATITMAFGSASRADPGWIAKGLIPEETIQALSAEGYIRLGRGLFNIPVFFPAEKFTAFLIEQPQVGADLQVKLADFDKVEITGIAERDRVTRVVEGVKHYTPNELGTKILGEDQLHRKFEVVFVKFDDGWRID